MLEIGMKAPDFTLSDKNGDPVSLTDFRGKQVILYFYSKDNTSGCTKQACGFAERYDAIKACSAEVIGISKDTAASHAKFAEKHGLPFVLLADPDHLALESYGVWQEKTQCGKTTMGTVRTTFLIDEEGTITHIWNKAKADKNPEEVLAHLTTQGA